METTGIYSADYIKRLSIRNKKITIEFLTDGRFINEDGEFISYTIETCDGSNRIVSGDIKEKPESSVIYKFKRNNPIIKVVLEPQHEIVPKFFPYLNSEMIELERQ